MPRVPSASHSVYFPPKAAIAANLCFRPIADIRAAAHHIVMDIGNLNRASALLAQNQRKRRAEALMAKWAAHGLVASTLTDDRYRALIQMFRGGKTKPPRLTVDLLAEMRDFLSSCDTVVVVDWDVDAEPALLVSAAIFIDKLPAATSIYPDGFIIFDEAARSALVVDLDEDDGAQTNVVAWGVRP